MTFRGKLILLCATLLALAAVAFRPDKSGTPSGESPGSKGLKPMNRAALDGAQALRSSSNKTAEQKTETKTSSAPALKVGEKLEYKGFVLMKVEESKFLRDDEVHFIEEQWRNEAKNFILHELGKSELTFQDYLKAVHSSFEEYDSRTAPIQREIRERFVHNLQLIHGEDLGRLYEASWASYRNRLGKILGSNDLARFEEFRDRYGKWVYEKFDVGWHDLK